MATASVRRAACAAAVPCFWAAQAYASSRRAIASLSTADVESALADLPGWAAKSEGGVAGIHRDFVFADFIAAWGFMSRCALIAEKMDHHPEWFNVYNKVNVRLSTHDASGITAKDLEFAKQMNAIAAGLQKLG